MRPWGEAGDLRCPIPHAGAVNRASTLDPFEWYKSKYPQCVMHCLYSSSYQHCAEYFHTFIGFFENGRCMLVEVAEVRCKFVCISCKHIGFGYELRACLGQGTWKSVDVA